MQVLKWSSWDFLSQLILQKMKKVQQYTHGCCYISLYKFKSFDQFNTAQTASNFRHLLSCVKMFTSHRKAWGTNQKLCIYQSDSFVVSHEITINFKSSK